MKIHRISLSAKSYAKLSYIAALEQINPKDWMEQRIEDAWSQRDSTTEIVCEPKGAVFVCETEKKKLVEEPNVIISQGVDIMHPEHKGTTIDLKSPSGKGHKGTSAKVPTGKKLSEDQIALAKLKELYHQDPRPSMAAMGREIGYPRVTVHDNINRLKERGEL